MSTTKDVKSRLQDCKDNLKKFTEQIQANKQELEKYYKRTYSVNSWTDTDGNSHDFKADEFEETYEKSIAYVNKQKIFIEQVAELSVFKENKFSAQIKALLDECLGQMDYIFTDYETETLLYGFTYHRDFSEDYTSILILSKFSSIDSNVVLIGGNGSGKSSLAKTLKGDDQEHISVIPAQKTLYFSLKDKSMLATKLKELQELLLQNNIDKSKTEDDYDYFEYQNSQFTKLIVAMREEYTKYLITCEDDGCVPDKQTGIFGGLRRIYNIIFPDIELDFKTDNERYMNCRKNGNTYHINALSEGEKAVMYYSISVLMAKKDSFIVVDEPETYLNPSLTNVLWDILIKERQDCQFIFITHSVDFVLGRSDSKIAWIKNFQYPKTWEFEFVEDNFALPKSMLTEVLGSPKSIAFCEGDDKSSTDYKVYRSLLGEKYTVIPVGGHLNVINYCEALSKADWIGRQCIGIVDGDYFSEGKVRELSDKKVFVLPFNEIEMLLLSDLVIEYTMRSVRPVDAEARIAAFKDRFWKIVTDKKEKIILTATKNAVDEYVQKEKIQKYDSLESIKDSIKHISEYDVDNKHDEFLKKTNEVIDEKDYNELLRICNLKYEVSNGIANTCLDSDYTDKAIQQIMINGELQRELCKKYFSAVSL